MKLTKMCIKKPSPRWIAKNASIFHPENPIGAVQKLAEAAPDLTPDQVSSLRSLRLLRGSEGR